jgi:hypothetical protein
MARRAPPPTRELAAPRECGERDTCHSGVTTHSSPIATHTGPRPWTPVAWVVAAALALGGIAGAASLADGDDTGPGDRPAVQYSDDSSR